MDGPLPQVFVLLLVLTSLPLVRTETCGVGENCGNGCTCVDGSNCNNVTKNCTCNTGLDGPTCNRRNIALGRPAVQSSTYLNQENYNAHKAVDGEVGHDLYTPGCTHTRQAFPIDKNPSWTVTLNSTYSIYRFQIYNRDGDCDGPPCGAGLNGFILYVGNSSTGNFWACYRDSTTSNDGPGDTIDGVCDNTPIPGDTVRITLPGYRVLTLCEVKLFVCTAGTYGTLCNETCGFCAGGRQVCDGISGDCPDTDPRCLEPFAGPKCKDCSPGRYGETCQTCGFCADGQSACDTTSGDCPDRSPTCMAGYTGARCCSQGWYGETCQRCGFCADGRTVCDTTSGDCPDRSPTCMAGYTGARCETACSPGRYGPDCKQACSFCDDGRTVCDSTSGYCPDKQPRCMAGYSGLKCDTECTNSTWGADCEEPCGNCYNGTACHRTSGDCPVTEGSPVCMSGYIGNACSTREPLEKTIQSAPNPAVIGGSVTGSLILVVIVVVVVIIVFRRHRERAQGSNTQELYRRKPKGQIYPPSDRKPEGHLGVWEEDQGVCENEIEMPLEDDNLNPYSIPDVNSNTAPVQGFLDYAVWKKNKGMLKAEFEKFPDGLCAKHDVADKPENVPKNRYKSLVTCDHSRVILSPADDGSDYINASYIHGYGDLKRYIAAQGPNDVTVNDFIRMIWEQNAGIVVMLTDLLENTKNKCHKYWPDNGSVGFGQIEVTLQDEELYANFTVRTLLLSNVKMKGEVRVVKQFHFTGWPDHGAPSQPAGLLQFREKVNKYKTPLKGPIVIHSSAGVGRTGTFIALDYLIDQAQEEGVVDVPGCVHLLREQRVNMVQTPEQYTFLHEALAEALSLGDNSVPKRDFLRIYSDLKILNPKTGKTKMTDQFEALEKVTQPLDEASLSSSRHADNVAKNRSDKILAGDTCRPFLKTPVLNGNDYINAVFLPTNRKKKGFILTQTPLQNTVVDFWRLVYDHTVSVIVMLDWVDQQGEDVGLYWPGNGKTFEPFDVTVKDMKKEQGYSVWTYQLSHKNTKATHPIKHFRCNFWRGRPSSISSFLTVMQSVVTWQQQTGNEPVLVHCRDGFTKSGLYCVASAVMERLKADQEVNIVQTVRQMRVNRPEIITDRKQFQFLHEIVREYLESAHTYANVNSSSP